MGIFLFKGNDPPRVRRAQRQIYEDVHSYEHDPTVQYKKEGRYIYDPETGINTNVGPTEIWISPLLDGLTMDDFPVGHAFGNGASNGEVEVDGVIVDYMKMTFPDSVTLTDDQMYRLREIAEGIPPGNTVKNVRREFTEYGALSPELIDAELATLLAILDPSDMEKRLIKDLEYIKIHPTWNTPA